LWKDRPFEKKKTKVDQWKRKGGELWASDIKEKVPKKKPKPVKEVRPEPELVEKPVRYTAKTRQKSIKAALAKLTKNYKDGLLAESVYKDLRAKYTEELKKLKGF